MARKLFCELGPAAWHLSVLKNVTRRRLSDLFQGTRFASESSDSPLPVLVYRHRSLIRRRLGNVDMQLQENKAVNLALAAPRISGLLIRPGQTFSFWHRVGPCTVRRGYRTGLTIAGGVPSRGIGGGMCQMTNLIHWMALHSGLSVSEYHHHDRVDLFPDFGRQVPFGAGTSIFYNYVDYRLTNHTQDTYQLRVWVEGEYLRGELRCSAVQPWSIHISAEDEYFVREDDGWYRHNIIVRHKVDRITGSEISREVLKENHARVMYAESYIDRAKIRHGDSGANETAML